jgi:3-hydroxy-9,10-secoandrosta-1,3,5(10)-triene-9,17-dione monooxygenase reductase component
LVYPSEIGGNPDIRDYRTAIGHFASGVTVVTSRGANGPSGLTASAVCSLSLEPLLMIVCIDNGSRTLEAIRHSRRLAVNVLARHQEGVAATFASKAPEPDKFSDVPHMEVDGIPVLGGVVAWLTGGLRELMPGGDHVIGVAEVEAVGAPGGEPLVYYRGAYHALME